MLEKIVEGKEKKKVDYELLHLLLDGPKSKKALLNELGITPNQFDTLKTQLRDNNINITYDRGNKQYFINKKDYEMSPEELEVNKAVKDLGLKNYELKAVLKNLRTINPRVYTPQRISFSDEKVKFGMFSDCHIGHVDYRPDVLSHAVENWRKQDLEFILNGGDTLEGMSGREGHIYELTHLGYSKQKDFFAEQFEQFSDYGWTVYSIEAEKSHSGWYGSKANQGVDVGKELERASKPYKFLGYDEQDLKLDNGLKIRLRHPGGGTPYAISYRLQKYIESIGGGDKPNILGQGHLHKSMYFFYRNIHAYDLGCLQNQSPWMRKMNTPAHVGYWTVTAYADKKGVERILSEFTPFYD